MSRKTYGFYIGQNFVFLSQHFSFLQNFFFFGETFFLAKLFWCRLAMPGYTLATPVAMLFSNVWTNKHTLAKLYYRLLYNYICIIILCWKHAWIIQNGSLHRTYNLILAKKIPSFIYRFAKKCKSMFSSHFVYNILQHLPSLAFVRYFTTCGFVMSTEWSTQ